LAAVGLEGGAFDREAPAGEPLGVAGFDLADRPRRMRARRPG
jgi:hypothetical protein